MIECACLIKPRKEESVCVMGAAFSQLPLQAFKCVSKYISLLCLKWMMIDETTQLMGKAIKSEEY